MKFKLFKRKPKPIRNYKRKAEAIIAGAYITTNRNSKSRKWL